jgi:hypothetical protein
MNKQLLWVIPLLVVVLGGVGISFLYGQSGSSIPSSLIAVVNPELTTVNQQVVARFTVPIPAGADLPLNINLIRIEPNGTNTVVGTLNDTGTNSDATAGDRTYTAQLSINEAQPKTLVFRTSAAFRGQLRRTLSSAVQFAVLAPTSRPVVLPPDPGEAGKTNVAGIDSDNDGVRDDVERFIVFSHPESESIRKALTYVAQSMQSATVTATMPPSGVQSADCLSYVASLRQIDSSDLYAQLKEQQLNTSARFQSYITQTPTSFVFGGPSDRSHTCPFDPFSLEN